jgi:hypothetical protein
MKYPVENLYTYYDDEREVIVVHFGNDDFGLRLTNGDGDVTRVKLSKRAAVEIFKGLALVLNDREAGLRQQLFLEEPDEPPVWRQMVP